MTSVDINMSAKTTGKRGKKVVTGKKEVQLSISKDVVNTKNRKTFGEDDDDNDAADDPDDLDDGMGKAAAVPAKKDQKGRVAKGKKAENKVKIVVEKNEADDDDDDDDAPEVVKSGADEIKRLRELHEQMMLPTAKKMKKRRRVDEAAAVGDNDEELDASILAAVGEADANDADLTDEEEDGPAREKINKEARKSRRIGHIEVSVLGTKESIIEAFGMPRSAQEFAAAREGSQPRTKFGSFRSQKKLAPSKAFSSRK